MSSLMRRSNRTGKRKADGEVLMVDSDSSSVSELNSSPAFVPDTTSTAISSDPTVRLINIHAASPAREEKVDRDCTNAAEDDDVVEVVAESDSSVVVKTQMDEVDKIIVGEPSPVNLEIREILKPKASKMSSVDFRQPGKDPTKAVNIAVASRSLFKLNMDFNPQENPNKMADFVKKTVTTELVPFEPGSAFTFISALGTVNRCLLKINPQEQERFNIILMSHNHAHVGVKLINSINHHKLHIERMCLTGGASPVPHYLEAYNVSLFLTSYPSEVEKALECGFAAAVISDQIVKDSPNEQLRVAFDLDAVLFSDEAEKCYKAGGLKEFFKHEKALANEPLEEGPLKDFAQALGRMQQKFLANKHIIPESPIRIYIVTARSAASSGERAIKTLRAWGLHIDEIHFLAGAPKGPILNAIKPHIFFDDQHVHIESAQKYGISAAQVPNDNRYRPRTPTTINGSTNKEVKSSPCETTPSLSTSAKKQESSEKHGKKVMRNLSLFECDDEGLCSAKP